MQGYVALFRAVNVGGRGKLPMSDLRGTAARLGLTAPRTLLRSGNLVFRAEPSAAEGLAARLEAAVAGDFGLRTVVILRSSQAWRKLIVENPFPEIADADPAHLLVMSLRTPATATAEASLRGAMRGSEQAAIVGDTAYLTYPDGIGRSKLTASIIERQLGIVGTARNWTTTSKIAAMLDA